MIAKIVQLAIGYANLRWVMYAGTLLRRTGGPLRPPLGAPDTGGAAKTTLEPLANRRFSTSLFSLTVVTRLRPSRPHALPDSTQAPLVSLLFALWTFAGPSWAQLGPSWDPLWPLMDPTWDPTLAAGAPTRSQEGPKHENLKKPTKNHPGNLWGKKDGKRNNRNIVLDCAE